jgi:hypothetical protein
MHANLFRALLLILFFLFAQAGALAHGVTHILDQAGGHEPVCEQCLAYAPIGAGAASMPQPWFPPMPGMVFTAEVAVASPAGFQPCYQSRAPPRV